MKNIFALFFIVFFVPLVFGEIQSKGTGSGMPQEKPIATIEWHDMMMNNNTSQAALDNEFKILEGQENSEAIAILAYLYLNGKGDDEAKVVNVFREHLNYLISIARDEFAPVRGRQTEKVEGRKITGATKDHYYPQKIEFASSYTIGNSKSDIGRYEAIKGAPNYPSLVWGHYIKEFRIESLAKFEGMSQMEELIAKTTLLAEYAKLLDKAIPSSFGEGKYTRGYVGEEYPGGGGTG